MTVSQAAGQGLFFLCADHGDLVYRMDIRFDRTDRERRLQGHNVVHNGTSTKIMALF